MECFGWEDPKAAPGGTYGSINPTYLFSVNGSFLGVSPLVIPDYGGGGFLPVIVWWDADVQRELIYAPHSVGSTINKYAGQGTQAGGIQVGGFDGTLVGVADIIGDWREEIITSTNAGELRIYTTTIPARDRRVTLMQDPIYRTDMAHQAMRYVSEPMMSASLTSASSDLGATPYSVVPQKLIPGALTGTDARVKVYDLHGRALATTSLSAGTATHVLLINDGDRAFATFVRPALSCGKNAFR